MDGTRRRLVVAAAIAALGVAGWLAASRLLPGRGAGSTEHVDRAEYLRPLGAAPPGGGEVTSPFTGFALSIDTEPPGAVVSVGGKVRGEAPVLAGVSCAGAEVLEVRAEKPGYRPARREVACRADTLVKLTLRLSR